MNLGSSHVLRPGGRPRYRGTSIGFPKVWNTAETCKSTDARRIHLTSKSCINWPFAFVMSKSSFFCANSDMTKIGRGVPVKKLTNRLNGEEWPRRKCTDAQTTF